MIGSLSSMYCESGRRLVFMLERAWVREGGVGGGFLREWAMLRYTHPMCAAACSGVMVCRGRCQMSGLV